MGSSMPMQPNPCLKMQGIVLAGGKSRRFGQDKALAKVGELTLLEHAIGLLQSLALEVTIITQAARNYSFPHCTIIEDLIPEKGPLGGLYTACAYYKKTSLLVLTCDMPGLRPAILQTLLQHYDPEKEAVVFTRDHQKIQPFPGIYQTSIGTKIRIALSCNKLSMHTLLDQLESTRLSADPLSSKTFLNINHIRDLESFTHRAKTFRKGIKQYGVEPK